MSTSMTAAITAVEHRLLRALAELGGRATVGDLAQRSALPSHEVERVILGALSHVGGHVAVDEHGNLVYSIARKQPLPTFLPPLSTRIFTALYEVFKAAFFAALSVALVMYFSVYIVILLAVLIAGIAAAAKGNDCDCDCDCKGSECGAGGCDGCGACCDGDLCHGMNRGGDKVYGKVVGASHPERVEARAALRQSQEVVRSERRAKKRERSVARAARLHNALGRLMNRSGRTLDFELEVEVVRVNPPFFRAVRDFVFGPPRMPPSPAAEVQNVLGFIRDHDGRITATDAVLLTGLPLRVAERVLLELAVQHHGDVEASEEGVVVYTFDRFMVSVAAEPDERKGVWEPPPWDLDSEPVEAPVASLRDYHYVWERLEKAPAISGVPADKRGWIYGLNILNLCASAGLLLYYGSGERLVGPAIGLMSRDFELWSLGILPFVMSLGVFVIPLVRWGVEGLRDGGRKQRNVRRILLLGLAHRLMESAVVSASSIRTAFGLEVEADAAITNALTALGVELEATVSTDGELVFGRAHRELSAVSVATEVDPSKFALKAIVYDTSKPL